MMGRAVDGGGTGVTGYVGSRPLPLGHSPLTTKFAVSSVAQDEMFPPGARWPHCAIQKAYRLV